MSMIKPDFRLIHEFDRITGLEDLSVDLQVASGQMDVDQPASGHIKLRLLITVEHRGIDTGLLMDAHRALRAVGRSDQAEPTSLV